MNQYDTLEPLNSYSAEDYEAGNLSEDSNMSDDDMSNMSDTSTVEPGSGLSKKKKKKNKKKVRKEKTTYNVIIYLEKDKRARMVQTVSTSSQGAAKKAMTRLYKKSSMDRPGLVQRSALIEVRNPVLKKVLYYKGKVIEKPVTVNGITFKTQTKTTAYKGTLPDLSKIPRVSINK